jgi:hypothetical protein
VLCGDSRQVLFQNGDVNRERNLAVLVVAMDGSQELIAGPDLH